MMRWMLMLGCVIAAPSALAQEGRSRTIEVTGTGTVQTMPDVAMLDIWLRGEGATADEATSALAAKQKAVAGGLAALLGGDRDLTTGNVTILQVRGDGCADGQGYDRQPRLSTGTCAIRGYIATMQLALRTHAVTKAATAVGLVSRLGASDARLQGYSLSDPDAAQARARAAAVETARRQAMALASSAGVRLGGVMTVRDQMGYDVVVSAQRAAPAAPPPPPPPPPPVEIDAKPRPIDTRAQVYVTYAIVD